MANGLGDVVVNPAAKGKTLTDSAPAMRVSFRIEYLNLGVVACLPMELTVVIILMMVSRATRHRQTG